MVEQLGVRSILRRFLVLTGLRWLPLGLLAPVLVLLPLDRGLRLSDVGFALAFQGFVVLALEVPTGGLADSIGRRRMLLAASVASVVSLTVFALAQNVVALACAAALLGVYRALDSGPLESWYVDESQARDPQAQIDVGIGRQNTVMGLSIGLGALAGAAVVTWRPVPAIEPMLFPVLLALGVQVVGAVGVWVLMEERHLPDSAVTGASGIRDGVREVPRTISASARLLRASPVLLALSGVELLWGLGAPTFENLFSVRLSEVTVTPEAAAAMTGTAVAVGWLASSAGAAATPRMARRWGAVEISVLLRVLQGAAVVAMGLFAGVVGVLAAYVACYVVHGASGAAHMTLLHRHTAGGVRSTMVSINSMMAQGAGAVGAIGLSVLAERVSVSAAMIVGGVVLAAGAPLYLFARAAERERAASGPAELPVRDATDEHQ
ncbi:MFS transporter [Streptomyces sp. TR02-1]|uniref:MFS transporter n=1 Tax=Streptomyces sp. TR02-1 TaxID=3385977 RepID=UPI00399F51B8